METYLIAGLGNPDKKYENTRHNAGFKALDLLSERLNVRVDDKKFRSLFGTCPYNGRKLILLKPQTYMNLSGDAVQAAAAYFNIDPSHVIVMYDDINFPCGKLRIRASGSAGGHNGMKSIINCLGSDAFPRVRIGVGAKAHADEDLAAHVLGRFPAEERAVMQKSFETAGEAALSIIDNGVPETMNRFNGLDLNFS